MPKALTWIHIGDLHASEEDGWESIDRLRDIVSEVSANVPAGAVAFIYLPGDIANHGTADQYRRVSEALQPLAIAVHTVPGDHDFEPKSLDAYRQGLGADHLPVSIDCGGRKALFLDIVSPGKGGPDFRLGGTQFSWLKEQLNAGKGSALKPVVFMHAFPGDMEAEGVEIAAAYSDAQVAFVDTGHTHYNEVLNDGAVIYAATRSTGQLEEGDPGFAVVNVDGNDASWHFKALHTPWPFVVITSPADDRLVTANSKDENDIVVRARILGHDIAAATCSVDDGPRLTMSLVLGEVALWQTETLHLGNGIHTISVFAQDRNGGPQSDVIKLTIPRQQRPSSVLGGHESRIGEWQNHQILGTQLDPNAKGRKW